MARCCGAYPLPFQEQQEDMSDLSDCKSLCVCVFMSRQNVRDSEDLHGG